MSHRTHVLATQHARVVTVATSDGPRRVEAAALVAPKGYRRCWWCCRGRLIEDSDEAEAEHRWRTNPKAVDPQRWWRERAVDVEDDIRWEAARARRGDGGISGLRDRVF